MIKALLPNCLVILTILVTVHCTQMSFGCEKIDDISCCPNLSPVLPITIREAYSLGRLYVTFVPVSSLNLVLDNVCYSVTGLPDDPETFLLSVSRVFSNGRNQVISYVVSQPQPGVTRFGSSKCSFVDIPFATVTLHESSGCNLILVYRCVLGGDCGTDFDLNPPIFGMSYIPRPISTACIQKAKSVIRSFGFSDQEYLTYPMRFPTRCVFPQLSSRS